MPGDPFVGLSDSPQDRKTRENRFRKQKQRAFLLSLSATILVATATGVGGATAALVGEQNTGVAFDRFLGGTICGLVGGVVLLAAALWQLTRNEVASNMRGETENVDAGATLFWATVVGAIVFGSSGASSGLIGNANANSDALVWAAGFGALAVVLAVLLRRSALRKSRTGGGQKPFPKRE